MTTTAATADDPDDRLSMLEQCANLFTQLQADYYEEYRIYELSTLAVAIVYPLVSRFMLLIASVIVAIVNEILCETWHKFFCVVQDIDYFVR
jgi:hypothetical protein